MKYIKAETVLPKELLRELQKYVGGECIYVPKPIHEKKGWGEHSGGRKLIDERNAAIRRRFAEIRSIEQLMDEFFLSADSIKKIVYTK